MLEKLELSGTNIQIIDYASTSVQYLIINDCKKLQKIVLDMPKLLGIQARNGENLQCVMIKSIELETADFSGCSKLTDEVLPTFFTGTTHLNYVDFSGCNQVSNVELFRRQA